MTTMQSPSDSHIRDYYFVPRPASNMMYWVSISKTESRTGHDVGCESNAAVENVSLEVDQGYDVRVKRLASLGFQCVVQHDGTLNPL